MDVITIDGELDVYTVPQLRELTISLTRRDRRWLVIDLDKCEYIDATGFGSIVGVKKRARAAGGDVALVCTIERILKVFRITALTKVFAICDSEPVALAALREPR